MKSLRIVKTVLYRNKFCIQEIFRYLRGLGHEPVQLQPNHVSVLLKIASIGDRGRAVGLCVINRSMLGECMAVTQI